MTDEKQRPVIQSSYPEIIRNLVESLELAKAATDYIIEDHRQIIKYIDKGGLDKSTEDSVLIKFIIESQEEFVKENSVKIIEKARANIQNELDLIGHILKEV